MIQAVLDFTKPFYNTIPLKGEELQSAITNAESQEEKIEIFFKANPRSEFTPFTVAELLEIECINSCRRAITNLTKKGILVKTGKFVDGRFGVKNNCWKLND